MSFKDGSTIEGILDAMHTVVCIAGDEARSLRTGANAITLACDAVGGSGSGCALEAAARSGGGD